MTGEKRVRISFIGDIMCEKPLLKAAKKKNGTYNFKPVFAEMKDEFAETDYVVGNLETVCAGEDSGYTDQLYSFNTPDSLIEAVKEAGIDMVTTANNHCLDRGIAGLKQTILTLAQYGIEHTGTYLNDYDRDKILIKKFNGLKVAFLAYTYGTNSQINNCILDQDLQYCVNLLQPQFAGRVTKLNKGIKGFLFKILFKVISMEQWIRIRKFFKIKYNQPTVDNNLDYLDENILEQIKDDITKAKVKADLIIFCLHSGGQFNREPGHFSKYIMDYLHKCGVDFVVGSHPHVVQKFKLYKKKARGIYSLGSFNMSPSSPYIVEESFPKYSLMLNLYCKGKAIDEISFSILKVIEDEKGMLTVWPINKLAERIKDRKELQKLKDEINIIYNRVLNFESKNVDIAKEYFLYY